MTQSHRYRLEFDGLVRTVEVAEDHPSRPGWMCYGWIILRDGQPIARGYGTYADTKQAASNRAEYLALIEGLEALADLNVMDEPVEVSGDAKCVLDQVMGITAVKSTATLPLYHRARRLARRFHQIEFHWTPRSKNRNADQLTRHAMRQLQRDRATLLGTLRAIGQLDEACRSSKLIPVLDLRIYQR